MSSIGGHTKTPGGQQASEKFQKQQAAQKGLGADNAPGHKEASAPGEAPVASDSYNSTVGIENDATNVPGEKGNVGKTVGEKPNPSGSSGGNSMTA